MKDCEKNNFWELRYIDIGIYSEITSNKILLLAGILSECCIPSKQMKKTLLLGTKYLSAI